MINDLIASSTTLRNQRIVFSESHRIKDEFTKRFMHTLSGVHNFRQRTRRFDCSDVLRPRRTEFVSHCVSTGYRFSFQFFIIVFLHVRSTGNASQTHTTKAKEVVIEMPRFLKDTVTKINACLPEICTCSKANCFTKTARVSTELTNVYIGQIAKGLIAQQNLSTWINPTEPRSPLGSSLTIDEPWFTTTTINHQLEDVLQLSLQGLGLEQQ